ncbi:MAG: DNA gyrase subunit A [Anaerolineaceae bacterium]|nr:DNA gyrase subunit A [Anaerolineaceae bacterium]MCB9099526.1 DNA gyrase subunit A [Anaerolineales bacterium]
MDIGTIKVVDIENEMKVAYLDYAMSVIVSRALPDARDGLKPVHRRILYAMHDMGIRHNTAYRKSARVVGDVLGKYHPHGDSAVYDTMVRMAQEFSMRYPLIDGQGNFGSVDGDSAAAMRYTEARLSRISQEMLADIDKNTIDWMDNFDGSLQEPEVLPARLPNLLLNGTSGIAVGMATNIPPHNLNEICDAITYLIDHYDTQDDVTVEDLMNFVKGPDFPTGASLMGREGIIAAYATGKGKVTMRATAKIEDMSSNRHRIVVTEIPYQVNKSSLLERIADLVRDGKLKDISDLRDESDRAGMAIVIELKRGAQPKKVLNQLYKQTTLQSNFGINMLALLDGEPRVLPLKRALTAYIEHRQNVITRRTEYDLEKARHRAHILEGYRIALANLDQIIKTIRESSDTDSAKSQLMANFSLSEVQAQAILDMQLRRLAALERQKIEDEYQELMKTISYLEDLLANPGKILGLIKEDLAALKESYGDERRTRILADETGDFNEEDLVKDEEVLISITQRGYIKRVPSVTYRSQARGGRGVMGMTTRDEDEVEFLFAARALDTILYFTDKGKVYSEKAWQIPDASRTAKGVSVVNLINVDSNEKITATVAVPDFDQAEYLIMLTRKGRIKRTNLSEFESVRPSGLIAISLDNDDELGWVKLTEGNDEMILVSKNGQAIRFHEDDVRAMGRTAAGVGAMRLVGNDELRGMDVVDPEADLLVVTEKGFAKRTRLSEYNLQRRNGSGVRTLAKTITKTGAIVTCRVVYDDGDITLISRDGITLRTSIKDISQQGRATSGVRVMNLKGGDLVASAAVLAPKDDKRVKKQKPSQASTNGNVTETVSLPNAAGGDDDLSTNGYQEE